MPIFMSASGTTNYIGLATTFHDPAIAILGPEGEVRFAEGTERFLQNKRAMGCIPDHIVRITQLIEEYCDPGAEFVVGNSWSRKMHRLLRLGFALGHINREKILAPSGDRLTRVGLLRYAMAWIQNMQWTFQQSAGSNLAFRVRQQFGKHARFRFFPHHETHAAYACSGSPFEEAACMVVDGYGEMSSIAYYHYEEGRLRCVRKNRGAASLGLYYKILTELCGFDFLKGEEWKVMGLAPYGKVDDELYELLRSFFTVKGAVVQPGSRKTVKAALQKLELRARPSDAPPREAADMALTGQRVYSDIMEELLGKFHAEGLSENLVIAGGCALNSSFNGTVLNKTPFTNLYVPSAPADDGNAIGAALMAYQGDHPERPLPKHAGSPYLGSACSPLALENLVRFCKTGNLRHLPETICEEVAALLAEGAIVGWFQGCAEFGPRALGNRSILADPRSPEMKDKINGVVKFRESYRPFAPSILHEFGPEYFEDYQESRYMERTLRVREEVAGKIPSVVHVDRSARLQTVKKEWNERFYDLISAFNERTGVPILLNTSFNIMGKPIVHSVEDAIAMFNTTGLGALVIGDYLIEK